MDVESASSAPAPLCTGGTGASLPPNSCAASERSGFASFAPPSTAPLADEELAPDDARCALYDALAWHARVGDEAEAPSPLRLVPMPHPSAFAALESPGAVPERERVQIHLKKNRFIIFKTKGKRLKIIYGLR